MLDSLVQASYAAEGGGDDVAKSRRRQTDIESAAAPPSPGSFLDENFLDEKAYAKLEGPWPFRDPNRAVAKGGSAGKQPGPVARWLDGIRTPRQSAAVPRPGPMVPMATAWRPEPKVGGFEGLPVLERPSPAFARARDTRMTEGSSGGESSVVW
jgi:hypothetical protein